MNAAMTPVIYMSVEFIAKQIHIAGPSCCTLVSLGGQNPLCLPASSFKRLVKLWERRAHEAAQ